MATPSGTPRYHARMRAGADPHDLAGQPVPGGTGCSFGAELRREDGEFVIEVLDGDFAFLEMASAADL